jgi:hypothetical protein
LKAKYGVILRFGKAMRETAPCLPWSKTAAARSPAAPALAKKLRTRIEFAEGVLTMQSHTSHIVETVSLQGRKAIETIAYMMLAATEHGFGRANMPRDVKSQWNAETVFERLKRKRLDSA